MKTTRLLCVATALVAGLSAQNVAIFPAEYSNVPEGPNNSPNLPLAYGTSRVMAIYNRLDLPVPSGSTITKLGFREDHDYTTMNPGRGLQLEIRMGYTANSETNASATYDSNYVGTPVTVFGPAVFTLPNLRDTNNPLTNGQFFITLTTPFAYNPGSNNLVVEYRVFGTSGGGAAFSYYLDRADYYSPVVNGPAGCPHLSGGPAALTLQPLSINGYFSASIGAAPANSLCALVLSVGNQLATPYSLQPFIPGIAPACMGQVSPVGATSLVAFSGGGGTAGWSFYVPNLVSLNDLFISCQGLFFDFFAPGGVVVSNGAQVQIGIPPRTRMIYAQGPPASLTSGSPYTGYCPVAFFEYQ